MVALTLANAGRAGESIEPARLAVERDPDSLLTQWIYGCCCHWDGRFEEAVAAFETGAALSGRHHFTLANMAMTYADWGKMSEAEALYREIAAREGREYVPRATLALAAAAAGEQDTALELTRQSCDTGEPILLLYARNFPDYQRLRDDPRFDEILRRLKLPGMAD